MLFNHLRSTPFFNKLTKLLIAAGLLLISGVVTANQEYDIEILILEDLSGSYSGSENWPEIPEAESTDQTRKPSSTSLEKEKRIRLLPPDAYKLTSDASRIADTTDYRILIHSAWRQSGLDRTAAFPVHITSDNSEKIDGGSYIEGDITLIMSRYLHVSGNLTFYKQENDSYAPYPVKFDRRMKSRETHYIDHPMIGVIVLVTPVGR